MRQARDANASRDWPITDHRSAFTAGSDSRSPSGAYTILLLHHQRRHHTEHPVVALGVGKDVAVEGPGARIVAVDDDVPPLARGDVDGVALPRRGHRPATLA